MKTCEKLKNLGKEEANTVSMLNQDNICSELEW